MSFTGKWNAVTVTPMGDQEVEMELEEKDGVLTGIGHSQGMTNEITNGKVDGNSATFDVKVTKPMKITLGHSVELKGDSFEGTVKLGVFGEATISAKRV